MSTLAIVGISLAVVAAVVAVLVVIQRATAASARQAIADRVPAEAILFADEMANNFGVTSKGAAQLRGNGGLVLTREHLWFIPLVAMDELKIPRADIREVTSVRSHLGKTVGRALLKVDWGTDSAAFYVKDVPGWIERLGASRT